jgi:gamma-glutamylcysteine synthetase
MSRAEVQQFFETYRDNFNRLDADAVADTWHTQSGITYRAREGEGDFAAYTMWATDVPMRASTARASFSSPHARQAWGG